jgi:hypothetical protein
MSATIFSVWDQAARRYDYYQVNGNQLRAGVIAQDPNHLRGKTSRDLGIAADRAARPLPAGATKIGSGETARGLIAQRGGNGALAGVFDSQPSVLKIGLLAGAGYLLWRYIR